MAISRSMSKKAPSQNPIDFAMLKQQGGAHGKPQKVPDVLKSGPMREQIHGRKDLGKQ
jgi:hypothetical protein